MHASLLLSQLKRRYIANQNRLNPVTPHFPFLSMGNERSCCLTHLGEDYEMDFHFLNSASGHPRVIDAQHRPGARQWRGWTVGEETMPKEHLPLPVSRGEPLSPGPLWDLWLRGCDDSQRKDRWPV